MKQKYYLIYVTEHLGIRDTHTDYKTYGYFTQVCTINKGLYAGYDANPEYDRVTRFKSKAACDNRIKKLRTMHFGGEANSVEYDFECVEYELKNVATEDKVTVSRADRIAAKQRLKNILLEGISRELVDFEQTLSAEEYTKYEIALYKVASTMLKSIGM